jgi:hypothetical protein
MAQEAPDSSAASATDTRPLGVVPRSTTGKLLLLFALANLLLIFLAVWDVAGNGGQMVAGLLPLTVLWVFAACALNNVLAVVVYITLFRPWAQAMEPSETTGRAEGGTP